MGKLTCFGYYTTTLNVNNANVDFILMDTKGCIYNSQCEKDNFKNIFFTSGISFTALRNITCQLIFKFKDFKSQKFNVA